MKKTRMLLFVAGGLATVTLIVVTALHFIHADVYKPYVEAVASDALGMNVTIEGPLRFGVIPRLRLNLKNVHVRNRGTEIVFIKEAELGIELLPLFRREVRFDNVGLNHARIAIEKLSDGSYNYENPSALKREFGGLDLQQLSFAALAVLYTDKQSDFRLESASCKGELKHVHHPGAAAFLSRLSLSGKAFCKEVREKDVVASDLKFDVDATDGVFDFKPITLQVFGGQGSGTVRMNRSGPVPVIDTSYSLSKFHIEEFVKAPSSGKAVSGLMDFSATLSMRGRTSVGLRQSANGQMSLSGMDLTLSGIDLDNELAKYKSTQSFNLFDMTGFLFAGPIGLAITKGYSFSSLARQSAGSTKIRTVVSTWKVENGVAHANDVALATDKNRLALQGGLDFVKSEFDDIIVSLLDSDSCADVLQRVHGPFNKPVIESPSVLKALVGPVLNLFNKAKNVFHGASANCVPFYTGSVEQPK